MNRLRAFVERSARHRTWVALGVCFVLALSVTRALRHPSSLEFPLFGDGHYYFLQTFSLLVDRDLDLANQRAELGDPLAGMHGDLARGLGNSVLWAPFFAIGAAWGALHADDTRTLAQYAAWGCRAGTLFYTLLSLWLLFELPSARRVRPVVRALLLCALCAGTPLGRYTFVLPQYNHVLTFFLAVLLLRAHEQTSERAAPHPLPIGLVLGAALTTRPELCLLALPLALPRPGMPAAGLHLQWLLRIAAIAALPAIAELLVFRAAGHALLPHGFLELSQPLLLEAWFGPRNGFFAHQPLLWLAAAPLLGALRKPQRMALLALLVAAFAFGWVQAAAWDVQSGFAFGARRFLPLLPYAYLGLCELASAPLLRRRVAALALASFGAWASWHGYFAHTVERAAAIDHHLPPPEGTYLRTIGIATSAPFLTPRVLALGIGFADAYRVAFRTVLGTGIGDKVSVDPLATASPRARDLVVGPGAWILPIGRAPLCAIGVLVGRAPRALTLDGIALGRVGSIGGYDVFRVAPAVSARWVRLELPDPALQPETFVLDARCHLYR